MIDLSEYNDCYFPKKDGSYPVIKKNDYGIRPAGKKDECFYCHSKIGEQHKKDCVIVCKKVKLKATIEFVLDVPNHWEKENILYHYNNGTWCSDNLLNYLENWKDNHKNECLCRYTKIEIAEEE